MDEDSFDDYLRNSPFIRSVIEEIICGTSLLLADLALAIAQDGRLNEEDVEELATNFESFWDDDLQGRPPLGIARELGHQSAAALRQSVSSGLLRSIEEVRRLARMKKTE